MQFHKGALALRIFKRKKKLDTHKHHLHNRYE